MGTTRFSNRSVRAAWARDTKLDRDVAIKVLPEDFATDPDRLARFEREAKLLVALNHPNIAAIYRLVEAAGADGAIEGPTAPHRARLCRVASRRPRSQRGARGVEGPRARICGQRG